MNILIVEDNTDMCLFYDMLFTSAGFTVKFTARGDDFDLHLDMADVLLVDYNFDTPMGFENGFAAAKYAKAFKDIKVIMASASSDGELKRVSEEYGNPVDVFVSKPFAFESLVRIVKLYGGGA